MRKLPGKTSYSDITLKWGVTDSTELWDWRQQIVDGNVLRKNGSIVVFDLDNRTEVARWNFVRAWPTKWEGPAFNAKGNDIAIDTLVLAHEGLPRPEGVTVLVTEVDFELPKGYVDADGNLHRKGVMRLATAADEIYPLKDPRVQNWPAYLIVILLSRVVTRLGSLAEINPGVIEGLFSEDLAYLQDLYNRVNGLTPQTDHRRVPALRAPARGGGAAAGGIAGYPLDRVHQEVAFLGRHAHWTLTEVLEPRPRRAPRWVHEIADLAEPALTGREEATPW